jgi:anti-sigma regulatory factor (Ser/Thr protein kinase)
LGANRGRFWREIWVERRASRGGEGVVNRLCALRAERVSIRLAGRAENIGRAREFVTASLGAGHPCARVVELIVSELVTNSIVHSRSGQIGGMVTVALAGDARQARVEVTDAGGPELPRLRAVDCGAESGRGLQLVDALATGWGCGRGPGETTVTWAEVIA